MTTPGPESSAPPSSGSSNSTPTGNTNVAPSEPNTNNPQEPVVSKPEFLFATIPGAQSILSFQTQNPTPGTTLPAKAITGIQGFLGEALAYDAVTDRLYASTGPNILVFDKASTLSGVAQPSRTIQTSGTGIMNFSNIVLDRAADTLFLAGSAQYQDVLAIIGNASTASGAVAPDHTYAIASGSRGFAVDTKRKLLYGLGSTVGVFVFDLTALQELTGPVSTINQATRVMVIPEFSNMTGVAIDQERDRLYIAGFGKLAVVETASTAKANVAYQSFTISAHSTTFDAAHDRLYVGAINSAYIINDASALKNGSAIPATVVVGNPQNNYYVGGFAFP
ncbi:hypothetical protein J2W27_000002 [Variovorax boronicumulans]|uniref:hypothetical protein n=1 Tax=Variovorax boronicumulans TaxID=436515 RepID=UPI002784DA60|nr:hypothetical protein [Variovorax boronicumulans]MDP9907909.1 hypothetical protein [Variovorax boronicumulans]